MEPQPSGALPTIGRYELVSGIASGGMGAVLLARLAAAGGFQRLFALKLLHKEYTREPEFLAMFLDEARIAARIHHPNVVSIQEVGESPQHGYFLVMDYIEGFPLSDIVPRLRELSPRQRWRLASRVVLDVLQGLDAAHTLLDDEGHPLKVVHRDISPQNILVGVDGIARVTDFGIAHAASRLVHTREGQVKGKIGYMSPEQVRAQPVDARSDLFSVGVVLWEAITQQRLFKGPNQVETVANVVSGRISPLSAIVPDVPTDIDAVCMTALSRDPSLRFQSARAFANAMESALRPSDLVGTAHEIGEFINRAFADKLAERRAAVRRVAHDTIVSGGPKPFDLPEAISAHAPSVGLMPLEVTKSTRAPKPIASPAAPMPVPVPARPAAFDATLQNTDDEDEFDRRATTAMSDDNASPAVRALVDQYRASLAASEPVRLGASPQPQPRAAPAAAPFAAPPSRPAAQPFAAPAPASPMPAAGVAAAWGPPQTRPRTASSPSLEASQAGMPFGTPQSSASMPPNPPPTSPGWASGPPPTAAPYAPQAAPFVTPYPAPPSSLASQAAAPTQPVLSPAKPRTRSPLVYAIAALVLGAVGAVGWFIFLRGH